jgi:two-component system LytT family sensor kinase
VDHVLLFQAVFPDRQKGFPTMTRKLRRWLMYWGLWAVLGVYMATMDAVRFPSMPFFTILIPMNMLQNLVFGCAGLGVLVLAGRWPLERFVWAEWKNWVIHLVGSIVLAVIALWVIYLIAGEFASIHQGAKSGADEDHGFTHFLSQYFHVYLLLLWAVLGAFHGIRIFDRYQKRELESAQLESQLAQSQTQALRMQLQPHFLFNTLNSIAALIHCDAEAADRMVSRLADLLRMTLDSGSAQEITLRQEMAFTDAYLGIEGIRFHDRLTVNKDVAEDCLNALVPAFLLQPLVENAIKHGVADKAEPSAITIRARHQQQWLTLEVIDTGRGMNGSRKTGIGTKNTADRLQLMYKDCHTFTLENMPGQGARALVRIPWSLERQLK